MSIKNINAWLDNFEDQAIPEVLRSISKHHSELTAEHGEGIFISDAGISPVRRNGVLCSEFIVTFRKPGNVIKEEPAEDFLLFWVLPLIGKADEGRPFLASWKGSLFD